MTRRQITLTTGSGHRRGHEDCGLGRLPGRKVSRAWLGRCERPEPTRIPACSLPLGLFSRMFSFFLVYKYDLPQPCLAPSRDPLLLG